MGRRDGAHDDDVADHPVVCGRLREADPGRRRNRPHGVQHHVAGLMTSLAHCDKELRKLSDWLGGFLVAETINFDWRTAPFKHYASFEHFYHGELGSTWDTWDQLRDMYRKLITGEQST
jgi:hypothetical protein